MTKATFKKAIETPTNFGAELLKELKNKGIEIENNIEKYTETIAGKPTFKYFLDIKGSDDYVMVQVFTSDKSVKYIFFNDIRLFAAGVNALSTLKASKIAEKVQKYINHKQLEDNFKGINEIKKAEREELQKRIDELKSENEALKKEIQELENQLGDTNE